MAVMEKRTIYISQPVLGDEEWEACREPLHSGWVTQGPKVKAFEEAFAKMKDGVRVFNCARGGIIKESALVEALNSGKVAAAGLDVYEQEPLPADHEFRTTENLNLTPH